MKKKLQQDERGISHVLLIVLVLVVIAAIGVVGWKVANKNKSPKSGTSNVSNSSTATGSTNTNTTAAESSCLTTYHDNNLCKFASNSASFEKTAYTATLSVTQQGTSSSMTLESDGKGNTELTGTSSGQTFSSITLDGVTYIQSGGSGPWIEYPSGTSAPTSNPTSSMNIAVGSSGITYKALGTAACGSLTCYKYQVTDSSTPGATQVALFDTSDYKLRQWQYTDSSGNSTTMTITYTPVNITKPSPVQSL